jgi:uncharacterized iron-regulated membrane protein
MKPAVRKSLLWLHTWTGLTIGLVAVVVAVSGALLLFRPYLERRLDPRFTVTPGATRLPLDEIVARARAAHPAAELESVRYFGDPSAAVWVYFNNKDYVHVDPYTGAVLGTRARYGEGFGWIEGLHKYLRLDSATGETVNGTFALVFVAIVLTGVVLWWPATRRALRAGLTLNRRLRGRPWQLNLHKTLGAYAAVVVGLSALTGAPIALDWLKNALYPLTGSQKILPPAAAKTEAATGASAIPTAGSTAKAPFRFQRAADRLATLLPGARESYIPLPKKGVVAAYAISADGPHPHARSYAWLRPEDASVLRFVRFEDNTAGFRLYYWMMALHTGVTGGWLVQLVLLLGAVAVPVLAWTGTASYLGRKARRAAPAASSTPAAFPKPAASP